MRCRLEIARNRYSVAISLSERITDKNTFFYKKIRYDALEGEIRVSGLRDDIRAAYEDELDMLEEDLEGVGPEQFIPSELLIS